MTNVSAIFLLYSTIRFHSNTSIARHMVNCETVFPTQILAVSITRNLSNCPVLFQVESVKECGGKEPVGESRDYHPQHRELDRTNFTEKILTVPILTVSTHWIMLPRSLYRQCYKVTALRSGSCSVS